VLLLNCDAVSFHRGQNNLSFIVKIRHPTGREAWSWLQITWIATEGILTHATNLSIPLPFLYSPVKFPLLMLIYVWICISQTFSFVSLLLWRGNQAKETKIFCHVGPIHNPYYSHATRRRPSVCRRNARVNLRMCTRPLLCHRHLITFPSSAGTWSHVFGSRPAYPALRSSHG
jgi:hypothetical protein